MRKLAPFVFTTIATLAGTAFAATNDVASPTVPANTANPQGMSYSDKSSTSPGTNAKMDEKGTMGANGMVATDPAVEKRNAKAKKAKLAKSTDHATTHQMPADNTSQMPNDGTNAAAANSLTGKSTGK